MHAPSTPNAPAKVLAGLLQREAALPPTVAARVEAAVADVVRGHPPEAPKPRAQTLTRVVRALIRRGDGAAAVALLNVAPGLQSLGDDGVLLHLDALEAAGEIEAVKTILRGLPIGFGSPAAEAINNARWRFRIPSDQVLLENLVGPLDRDVREIVRDLPVEQALNAHVRESARALLPLSAAPTDLEDFARRIAWGKVADRLLIISLLGVDDPVVAAFARGICRLVRPFDPAPLREAAGRGVSVLIALAHAGHFVTLNRHIPNLGLPRLSVGRVPRAISRTGSFGLGTKSMSGAGFLGAVKRVKAAPHLITIFPDGPDGREMQAFPLLGRKVILGLGAATLAWHSRAATFFAGTRWRDGWLEVYLREGPVAEPNVDRDAFNEAFHAFYLGCLAEIVTGPPENFAREGGMWRSIHQLFDATEEQAAAR